MTEYLSNSEHSKLKARLTRAKNTGHPVAVLEAVEYTLDAWSGKAWPDQWSTWRSALDDAFFKFSRSDAHELDRYEGGGKLTARFHAVADRFA